MPSAHKSYYAIKDTNGSDGSYRYFGVWQTSDVQDNIFIIGRLRDALQALDHVQWYVADDLNLSLNLKETELYVPAWQLATPPSDLLESLHMTVSGDGRATVTTEDGLLHPVEQVRHSSALVPSGHRQLPPVLP